MPKPDYEGIRDYALMRLKYELRKEFSYHNMFHTRDDVLPAVEWLAASLKISEEDLLLLKTAALYHDIGFVLQSSDHEAIGVGIAITILPDFGYSRQQRELIASMIMATRTPQQPKNPLGEILADADLNVLSRPDFWLRSLALKAEQEALGKIISLEEWLQHQIAFFQSHHYFTTSARQLWDVKKKENLALMVQKLNALKS